MSDVPILVFEDAPLSQSVELRKLVEIPKSGVAGGQKYIFDWHSVYNALGGIGRKEPVLIRSLELFREAVHFLREQLAGEAIIFMDLHMIEPHSEQGGGKFNLTPDDVSDDLLTFAACLDDKVKSKEDVLSHFNPNRLGLWLAATAASNPNWRGTILFASQRADVELDKIRQCFDTGDRILWRNLGHAMTAGLTAQARATVINNAVDEFLEQRKGPPFWPAETNGWFEHNYSPMPHDAPPPDSNHFAIDKVREYLALLLGDFTPPESWFQPPQWRALYETLKGLVGAHSVSAGCTLPAAKNLRLPAIPLLLAAQMSWNESDIGWLKSFEWDPDGVAEIMCHKNKGEAQDAIRAMAVFLEHLSRGSDGENQVIGVSWGSVAGDWGRHLWVDLKIDPLSQATGRGLLATIFGSRWGNGKGQTVGAYERMMERARRQGAAPSFSLCLYPISGEDGQTVTRLDFHALEG